MADEAVATLTISVTPLGFGFVSRLYALARCGGVSDKTVAGTPSEEQLVALAEGVARARKADKQFEGAEWRGPNGQTKEPPWTAFDGADLEIANSRRRFPGALVCAKKLSQFRGENANLRARDQLISDISRFGDAVSLAMAVEATAGVRGFFVVNKNETTIRGQNKNNVRARLACDLV